MNNRRSTVVLALLCLVLPHARAAEAPAAKAPTIAIADAWTRSTPPGMNMSAAYLTITHRGNRPDVLLGASSPVAQRVELHRTVVENGMSRMRPAGAITIAPGTTLRIEPTSLHLMLTGLAIPLLEGKTLPLTLRFRDAGELTVPLQIRPLGATSAHHGH